LNWDDYEKARLENFSAMRGEFTTGCLECGAQIRGTDEKSLEKRRRQHATLHLERLLYLKIRLGEYGDPARYPEYLERLTDSLARLMHSEFQTHLRFLLDREEIMRRLTVSAKGNLEWEFKQKWDSLSDQEKEGFMKLARELVATAFPETVEKVEVKDGL
jgi:hypothetical protein